MYVRAWNQPCYLFRPAANATFFTVSLFDATGNAKTVENLTGAQRFTFTIPVPDCETADACTAAMRWRRSRETKRR